MKTVLVVVLALMVLLAALAWPAAATPAGPDIPLLPQEFYGTITIEGAPAPAGSVIVVRGPGVLTDVPGNPLSTAQQGQYGGPNRGDARLIAQGNENLYGGAPLEFYVNGWRAQCAEPGKGWRNTFPFTEGVTTQLNLRYSSVPDTATPTRTPTSTRMPATATSTGTPTPTVTVSATNTATATATPTETAAVTPAATEAPRASDTPTATPSATARRRGVFMPLVIH